MIPFDPDQIVFGSRVLYKDEEWVVADKLGPPTHYITLRRKDAGGETVFARFVRIHRVILVKPTLISGESDARHGKE